MCPSSFPPAGLQCDRRVQAATWTMRKEGLYCGWRSSKTGKKLQSSWNCLQFLTSTFLLHAREIKFYLVWGTGIWGFWGGGLLTAKPNPNWYFPISIVYVFPIHLWDQNYTVFLTMTSHLRMGYGFISHSHHTPQIPLTSYRMNSTHSVTFERSPHRHGKK